MRGSVNNTCGCHNSIDEGSQSQIRRDPGEAVSDPAEAGYSEAEEGASEEGVQMTQWLIVAFVLIVVLLGPRLNRSAR